MMGLEIPEERVHFLQYGFMAWLAAGALIVVLGLLIAFLRWDLGTRLLRGKAPEERKAPERMV